MLTDTSAKYLGLSADLVYWAHTGPLRWSKGTRRLETLHSLRHHAFCILSFCMIVCYEVFLIFRSLQAVLALQDGGKVKDVIQTAYALCTYAIPVHFQTNTFHLWKELPFFVNSYLTFFDAFKKFVVKETPPKKNGCETLFRTFFILGGLINLQNCIMILKSPHKKFFLSSLLNEPKKLPFHFRLCFFLVHNCIWLNFWSQILFYGHLMFSYAFPGLFILQEMRKVTSNRTFPTLRRPDVFIRMYRCFQVEQSIFNYCLQKLFFPGHKVLMGGLAILSTYGAIKLHSPRAILMGFASFTSLLYLSILFRRLGSFFEMSTEVLCSWKGHTTTKSLKARLRSCPPITVNIGGFYVARKTTVLCMYGIIINMTINLLLSF